MMTLSMRALIYRNTIATGVELAECFQAVRPDQRTRLLNHQCGWPTRLGRWCRRRWIIRAGRHEMESASRR